MSGLPLKTGSETEENELTTDKEITPCYFEGTGRIDGSSLFHGTLEKNKILLCDYLLTSRDGII